jgi:uncharacterized protein YchJ
MRLQVLLLLCILGMASSFLVSPRTTSFSKLYLAGFGKSKPVTADTDSSNPKQALGDSDKCRCGSQVMYKDCCQKSHLSKEAHTPESLIQSRYSAYASDDTDFIIATTSTLSPDYASFIDTPIAPQNGMKRWAKSIRQTMIADYFFTRFEIESVVIEQNDATVVWHHLAIRRQDNGNTVF